MADFARTLDILRGQQTLTAEQMHAAVQALLSGDVEHQLIVEFLTAIHARGETVEELAGAAQALRDAMKRVSAPQAPIVDTCGTGGDGAKTFNISTASAIAIAACGVPVAKHGNRKITSSTGSADVLAELGINLEASVEVVQKCLNEIGICFCFAPHFHPAMRHVGPARRELKHPTIFNRLGPLANPASADRQVLGVGAEELMVKMAAALQRLGTARSIVVRGLDGVDEVSLSANTRVIEVTPSGSREFVWSPSDFGLPISGREALFADDPVSSAACIRSVFDGTRGPARDVVVANAAAGLWVAGVSDDTHVCAKRVQQAIDDGKASQVVQQLAEATNAK